VFTVKHPTTNQPMKTVQKMRPVFMIDTLKERQCDNQARFYRKMSK